MEFVAVHAGAGYQSESNKSKYKELCKEACKKATEYLKNGESSVKAITKAICVLEDNNLTNAGIGSNLCINGLVECDASLMNGRNLNWSAVGALQSIKNPIEVAYSLINEQEKEDLYGRIPPNVLVGKGASDWAISKGFCKHDDLVTESSFSTYNKYKRKLDQDMSNFITKNQRLDTVGAIAVDSKGNVAAGVSSGGILLKNPGRIGQAAMYGCGVWAQDTVAVSTSGVGEYLTKTFFAKECATKLLQSTDISVETLHKVFIHDFLNSPFLKNVKGTKCAGTLALNLDKENSTIELLWGHNTPTMCIAYGSSTIQPTSIFSKLPEDSELYIQSIPFKYYQV